MLSVESSKQVDIELARYPADQRRPVIMDTSCIVQTEEGWLAPETIVFVADYTGISPAQAYEVATFYNIYDLEPVGKYKLTVYINLPRVLRGGTVTDEYLKKKLGIGHGETTSDGKFTLVRDGCMGACGDAPVMLASSHSMRSFVTEETIDKKLAELK